LVSLESCQKIGHDICRYTSMPYPVMPSEGIKDTTSEHGNVISARDVHEEEEADEVPIIVESDTVVHPRTVVV